MGKIGLKRQERKVRSLVGQRRCCSFPWKITSSRLPTRSARISVAGVREDMSYTCTSSVPTCVLGHPPVHPLTEPRFNIPGIAFGFQQPNSRASSCSRVSTRGHQPVASLAGFPGQIDASRGFSRMGVWREKEEEVCGSGSSRAYR